MNKRLSFIAALICFIICIYIFGRILEKQGSLNNLTATAQMDITDISIMAVMENELARDDVSDNKKDVMGEKTDYTKLYPDLYTEYNHPKEMVKGKKVVYLTFDDGPSNNTFKILDILEELNVKATFFIVGSAITKEGEACLIRMVNEGHTIGIHTYSHVCKDIYCSIERYLDDFDRVYQQIYGITGVRVNIYRFPWGSNNGYSKKIKDPLIAELERRGFSCYDWNIDSRDSVGRPSPASIKHNIMKDLGKKEYQIILMHDSMNRPLAAKSLPDLIKALQKKGYEFDTLNHRKPYLFEW